MGLQIRRRSGANSTAGPKPRSPGQGRPESPGREEGRDPAVAAATATAAAAATTTTLMHLPTELHLAISQYLTYPDALSLKHSSAHFYRIVDTGINLKIDWLIERRTLHLECPHDKRCDLGSDTRFCRGSVKLLMQRRRQHMECESRPGIGCLVMGTKTCSQRPRIASRWRRWLRTKCDLELWLIPAVLLPILLCWTWSLDLLSAYFSG